MTVNHKLITMAKQEVSKVRNWASSIVGAIYI